MKEKRVDEIFATSGSLGKSIKQLVGEYDDAKGEGWFVCGFDSEYNSKRGLTISYQLYGENGRQSFIRGPEKLSLRHIAYRAYLLGNRRYNKILISSYFNTAELSQLTEPFWNDLNLKFYQVHPNSIFHIEGEEKLPRDGVIHNEISHYQFLFFDIWHFFASMKGDTRLASVAEHFGERKLEYDVTDLQLSNNDDPEFEKYAMNDARLNAVLFRIIDNTYRQISNVNIIARPTPANAALASYRRQYLRGEIRSPASEIRRLALFADWGGRVESGYVGKLSGVHEWDADSLYPRATLLLPNLPNSHDWLSLSVNQECPSFGEGVVNVRFKFQKDEEWPCLPVWGGTALYFPLSGVSYCTLGELRAAIGRNVSYQIIQGYYYLHGSVSSFHEFLRDQIHLKETGNPAIRAVAKANMNAGIGKFAQNHGGPNYERARKYIQEHPDEFDDSDAMAMVFAGQYYVKEVDSDHLDNFSDKVKLGSTFYPEWHALILGKAREIMARQIWNLPEYPRCLMVSTDSMCTTNGASVGSFQIVPFKHEFGPCQFQGVRSRLYSLTDGEIVLKVAHHGIPRIKMPKGDMKYLEYINNIIIMAEGYGELNLPVEGFKTLKEAVMTHDGFGALKERKVKLKPMFDGKRRLGGDGWTHPLKKAPVL
jgi:DNA polymerase type B, organellar and viral